MEGYNVTIKESSKVITARERVMLKDTGNAIKLDEACTADSPLILEPDYYAILDIHNEKSDNVDYQNYVVVDKSGTKYVTGSPSFWNSFKQICDEMEAEEEPYSIQVYKMESKNYKGKMFLTCSMV